MSLSSGSGPAGPDRRRRRLAVLLAVLVVPALAVLVPRLPHLFTADRTWTWHDLPVDGGGVLDLLALPDGPVLLAGQQDTGGVRVAAGADPEPFTAPAFSTTTSLDAAGRRQGVVARVGQAAPKTSQIAFSTDSGQSWFPALAEPGWTDGGGTVAVAANGATVLWASPDGVAAVTDDFARTWQPVQGLPPGAHVTADRVLEARFYAVTADQVLVSDDAGLSFRPAGPAPGGVDRAEAAPGLAGHVWFTGPRGLWRTTDGGENVERVDGFEASTDVTFAGSGEQPVVVLGTGEDGPGVYSSDDGRSWTRIDDRESRLDTATAVAADPRSGRVYVGLRDGEIRYGEYRASGSDGVVLAPLPADPTGTGSDGAGSDGAVPAAGGSGPAGGPARTTAPPGGAGGGQPGPAGGNPTAGTGAGAAPATAGSGRPAATASTGASAGTSPTGATTTGTAPTTSPTAADTGSDAPDPTGPVVSCHVAYTVRHKWTGGFDGDVTVTNTGPDPIDGWTLRWTYTAGQTLDSVSGATLQVGGPEVVIAQSAGAGPVPADGSVTFDYLGIRTSGPNTRPASFLLDGVTCATG